MAQEIKTADVEWINSRSGYPVKALSNTIFRFVTKNGLEYEMAFVHFLDIGSHPLYYSYLLLCNDDGEKHPADKKIGQTFSPIIHRFLLSNDGALTMFCHKEQSETAVLRRLFLSWAHKYNRQYGFDGGNFIQASGKYSDNTAYHMCLFYAGGCSDTDKLEEFVGAHADEIISMFINQRKEAYGIIREMSRNA